MLAEDVARLNTLVETAT